MLPPPVTDADGRRIRLDYTSRDVAAATPRRLKVFAVLGIVLFLTAPLWWALGMAIGVALALDLFLDQDATARIGESLWNITGVVALLCWAPVIWYAYPRRAAAAVAAHRLARGQCAGCLYPLRAVPTDNGIICCPECGAKWPASATETDRASPSAAE